jgi:hypothetical protein
MSASYATSPMTTVPSSSTEGPLRPAPISTIRSTAGDVTGQNFNETAAIESSPGIAVIGAYEVSEFVVLPLQEETKA